MQMYEELQKEQRVHQQVILDDAKSTAMNLAKVFIYFALGLLVSGVMAVCYPYLLVNLLQEDAYNAYLVSTIVFSAGLLISSIASIFAAFSSKAWLVGVVYAVYAVCLGGLLSTYSIMIGGQYVFYAFLVTGGAFLVMGVVGVLTKGRLSKWVMLLSVAAMCLSLVSLFNILLFGNSTIYWIVSLVMVVIFLLLVSVDVNRVVVRAKNKDFASSNRAALWEAFTLYSDFMVLLIYLLRFISVFVLSNRNN